MFSINKGQQRISILNSQFLILNYTLPSSNTASLSWSLTFLDFNLNYREYETSFLWGHERSGIYRELQREEFVKIIVDAQGNLLH